MSEKNKEEVVSELKKKVQKLKEDYENSDLKKSLEEKTREDISLRGKTARGIVKVANHLPVLGPMRVNGDLQNLVSEHERSFRFPVYLQNTQIDRKLYKMELLEKKGDQREKTQRYCILQLHGGGYYGRLHNTYRAAAVYFHEITGGFDVLSVDYRVAPEHPYPAALEDAVESYRWLLDQGYPSEHIIISGDSAGGGLTLALCMYLRDRKIALPAGLVTMSAWTDLTKSGDSYQDNYDKDPIFGGSRHTLVYKQGYYLNHDPATPYISPVYGVYNRFPPMLMQVGELEMLLDDTLSVAEKAKAAGTKVKVHVYPGMFHVFQLGLGTYPESLAAWEEVKHFIHVVTGEGFFDS
ncbi:MAG: alpha/beta hydrolase [Lachnospiraceae bacterium]|nr:alpha/beta hydrolase [Lachnospiraceae bacterium]